MRRWPIRDTPRGPMSDNTASVFQFFLVSAVIIAFVVTAGYFIWDNAKHMDAVRGETERQRIEQFHQRGIECIENGGAWIESPVMCIYSKGDGG